MAPMTEAQMLRQGKIGVISTDTLYGIVAAALHEEAVERVYDLKGRTTTKPCIVLISSPTKLSLFDIKPTEKQEEVLSQYWPGAVSIVLPSGTGTPQYLHRGMGTLAFRVPGDVRLREFLKVSGPLVAPSANPEGSPPATTIDEAKTYFGDQVDFYLDGGECLGASSTLISFDEHDSVIVLRKGRVSI